ncbi:hypothetical protein NH340_JMT00035 [Sarcoptes scabiei]|nr:hypothetical protein NH340_JMT00035 [Sarcoptes scabiei]
MNLLNPNEIIQLFSTKNHFKWSFSLWFFGQRSSLLYHGLVWFCLISQFSDPKIVCQSNIPQDYEIAQWYCLFKQTKIVQDDVEDSMQRFQLPYRINQIYACLLPTLIMMLFCLELPDFIRKHLSDCPQLQSLIDQIENLTSQHCWNDSSKIIWKNYLNIFDNRKRNNLCIIIVSMHFGSLLSLIFISALFFLAFNFDHSVLTYGFDYFVYYYNQYVNNQQIDHPKTKFCYYFYCLHIGNVSYSIKHHHRTAGNKIPSNKIFYSITLMSSI